MKLFSEGQAYLILQGKVAFRLYFLLFNFEERIDSSVMDYFSKHFWDLELLKTYSDSIFSLPQGSQRSYFALVIIAMDEELDSWI